MGVEDLNKIVVHESLRVGRVEDDVERLKKISFEHAMNLRDLDRAIAYMFVLLIVIDGALAALVIWGPG